MMEKIKFCFFPDFSDQTLLFFGTEQALSLFVDKLMALDKGCDWQLENDKDFVSLSDTKVTILLTDNSRGMSSIARNNSTFVWSISSADINDIIEKILHVIKSNGPSHNYLESALGEVVIMISKDEYPETFALKNSE